MNRYAYLIIAAIGLFSLSACNDGTTNGVPNDTDKSPTNYSLISLSPGNKWVYTLKEVDDKGVQLGSIQFLTYKVTKDTAINGEKTAVIQIGEETELMVQKSDGLYKWSKDSLGLLNLQMLYKYPLIAGESYPQDDGSTIRILWLNQKVSLTFASYDCIEILKIYKVEKQAIMDYQYYAKGVGLIKSLKTIINSETGDMKNYVQELSSVNF